MKVKCRPSILPEKSMMRCFVLFASAIMVLPLSGNTYHVSKSGNDSHAGDSRDPWLTLAKASRTLVAGDTVLIHSGIYNEALCPQNSGAENAPVCYFAYGDGEVVIRLSGSNKKESAFLIKGKGNTGFNKPVNFIEVKGLTFRGSNQYGICVNGGSDGLSGNNCKFENVCCDSNSVGAYFTCRNLLILNSEFASNKLGGFMVYYGGKNIHIRGSSFHHNGTKGNVDGMTLQDCENILIEDCRAYGQYDGFDIGSQMDENTGPGCRFIIFRRCVAFNNYNGNFPSSTTLFGPVCYQYCVAYENTDWAGGMVLYEAARNTHIWNCTIARVNVGVNFFQGPGPVYIYNNLIIAERSAISNEGGGKIINDYNFLKGSHRNIPMGEKTDSGSVDFVKYDDNNFHLTKNNVNLIDKGCFFLTTTGSGSKVSTIEVNKDPRIYFFPGDTIQISGTGIYVVKSMTENSITIAGKEISYNEGQGIHLPYNGEAPDIGAFEY